MSGKLRSDCILNQLTEDQRADLYDWCVELGYKQARELAAKPAPEGFGLQIHKTTLVRFAEAERNERRAQRLAELAATSSDNSSLNRGQSGSDPSSLQGLLQAARTEFSHAVYELSLAATQPDKFDRLERALHHIDMVSIRRDQLEIKKQELEVHRQSLVLDRDKFECNASRMALINIDKLTEIHRRPGIDDEAKIHLARKVCFGPVPGMAIKGVALPEARNTPGHAGTHSTWRPASPEPPSSVSSASSAVKDSKSEFQPSTSCPATAVIIPHPSRGDTLGHIATPSAPIPAREEVPSEPKAPRKMTAQQWIDQARNPFAVRRYIFMEFANGSERFEAVLKSSEKISIPDSVDC